MSVKGVHEAIHAKYTAFHGDVKNKQTSSPISAAMASCTSITYVRNKLVGDPLDIIMFEASGWTMTEQNLRHGLAAFSQINGNERDIVLLKRFDFDSNLRLMSVICSDENLLNYYAYVKGSPETVASICDPRTLPCDFASVLKDYTSQGLRVLALATRQLEFQSEA